jgi:hypothetical protein
MNFAVDNIYSFLAVGVIVVGQMGLTWLSNKNAKLALFEAKQANKAVNGNPVGEPRAYDMLGIIRDEIGSVSEKIDAVDNKLDKHLSWHQEQRQATPRSAPQSSGRTRKTVAKKAPVKKVASKRVAS